MTPTRARKERGGVTMLLVMVLLALSVMIGGLAVRAATTDLGMASSQRQAPSVPSVWNQKMRAGSS